jgi:hypothetical protein
MRTLKNTHAHGHAGSRITWFTYVHRHAHTCTLKRMQTKTPAQARITQARAHARTQTSAQTRTHAHARFMIHTRQYLPTHAQSHVHAVTCTLAHKHTSEHPRTDEKSRTHTRTHARTHIHIQTHAHAHTHTTTYEPAHDPPYTHARTGTHPGTPPHTHLEQVLVVGVAARPDGAVPVAPGAAHNMEAAANQAQPAALIKQHARRMPRCRLVGWLACEAAEQAKLQQQRARAGGAGDVLARQQALQDARGAYSDIQRGRACGTRQALQITAVDMWQHQTHTRQSMAALGAADLNCMCTLPNLKFSGAARLAHYIDAASHKPLSPHLLQVHMPPPPAAR